MHMVALNGWLPNPFLEPIHQRNPEGQTAICIAAFLDGVRLCSSYSFFLMLDDSFTDYHIVFRDPVFCDVLIKINIFSKAEE